MATLAELQAQLAQINAQTNRLGNTQIRSSGRAMDANQAQLMASQSAAQRLSQQIAQMRAAEDATGSNTAQGRLDEILKNARGDISRFAADPVDAMLMEQLKARATGGGPYNEEVRNSLMTQAGEDAAHIQRNQMAGIRGSGDPTDPSVQSQIAEANARRQAALQQARLGIGQVANLANYNAQGQALGQLSGFNQNRQGGQTAREQYLNSILGQINDLRQTPMQAPSVMTFMPQQQTQQPQYTVPQVPQQQYQPQTQPAAKPVSTVGSNGLTNPTVARQVYQPAPVTGQTSTAAAPPTQQQLTTPWNAQTLNPYGTAPVANNTYKPQPKLAGGLNTYADPYGYGF